MEGIAELLVCRREFGRINLCGICDRGSFFQKPLDTAREFYNRLKALVIPRSSVCIGEAEGEIGAEYVGAVFADVLIRRHRVALGLRHAVAVGPEDDALVHQGFERFVKIEKTQIAQYLADESGIKKMHRRVLGSADVLVNGAHPVDEISVKRRPVIFVVRVAELIPGRIDKCVHRIRIALRWRAAFGTSRVHEGLILGKRGFSVRTEFDVIGENNGQLVVRNRYNAAMRAVYDRDRRAPVALA